MSLQPGAVLRGRYRVVARLGEGGMGSVYKVEDLSSHGAFLALKELLDDSQSTPEDIEWARKHFDAEIALMRHLRHPRIPQFGNSFTEGTGRYFTMEFIPGENLDERLSRVGGPLPETDVLRWMMQICDVLAYLHGCQPPIIVRDLKPGNIMVTPAGDARLIDFGIARTYKPGQASNTENLGTMIYASPEHLGHSQTDARSDIYSLGATMYHLLTNREPTPMETPAPGALRKLVPQLGEQTERIVIRAMQLDPALRFRTVVECENAMRKALDAREKTRSQRTRVAPKRAPTTTAVVPAVTHAVSASPARPVPPAQITLPEERVCPRCGFINRQGARFCAQDGTRLSLTGAPARARAATHSGGTLLTTTAATGSQEQRAMEAFAAGQFVQAARLAEAAIAAGPATHQLYMLLGRIRLKLERPAEAAQAFESAVNLRPSGEALLAQGDALVAARRLDEALIAFTRARQITPDDARIACRLGESSLELGLLSQAEGELRAALMLRPGFPAALVGMGRIALARKQYDTAVALFEQAAAEDSGYTSAYIELGRTHLAQRKPAEALRALRKAVALQPNLAEPHTMLAISYHAIGQRTHAREELREAVRLNPQDAEARELLRQI
jgi:Flp pilus assembly protein TadD